MSITLHLNFSAAYVLLTTLVLADLFGAEKFTNSFGLLLLFQGVATFGGPPIVGKSGLFPINESLILIAEKVLDCNNLFHTFQGFMT